MNGGGALNVTMNITFNPCPVTVTAWYSLASNQGEESNYIKGKKPHGPIQTPAATEKPGKVAHFCNPSAGSLQGLLSREFRQNNKLQAH